jgi:hypothetical protein
MSSISTSFPLPASLADILREGMELSPPHCIGDLFRKKETKPSGKAEPAHRAAEQETTLPSFNGTRRWSLATGDSPSLQYPLDGTLLIEASALIHDGRLGSLGLIHYLPPAPAAYDAKDLGKWLRAHLETAAYLRHRLLEITPPDQPHFAVEICFIYDFSSSPEVRRCLFETLRTVMLESSLLHAIGVGLLDAAEVREAGPERVRRLALSRAFPWLLTATGKWLSGTSPAVPVVAPDPAAASFLRELTLQNFRLPGTRQLELQKDAGIHVVHGQNGTGKSSISEALELAVTGTIQRLHQDRDPDLNPQPLAPYPEVLRNRTAGGQATLGMRVGLASGQAHAFTIEANGLKTPLAPRLSSLAFLIDQPQTSSLATESPAERATRFLRAFFPEHSQTVRAYGRAQKEIARLRGLIPAAILEDSGRATPEDFDFAARFASDRTLIHCLIEPFKICPPPGESQGAGIHFGLTGRITHDWSDLIQKLPALARAGIPRLEHQDNPPESFFVAYAEQLDLVWEDLRAHSALYREHLATSAIFLEKLAGWEASDASSAESLPIVVRSYPERLNEWLRLCALCDLISTELVSLRIRARLSMHGGPDSTLPAGSFTATEDLSDPRLLRLQQILDEHSALRTQSKNQLDLGNLVDFDLRQGAHSHLAITAPEVEALNWTGQFLGVASDADGRLFGDAIRETIRRDRFSEVSIPSQSLTFKIGAGPVEFKNSLASEMTSRAANFAEFASGKAISNVSPSETYRNLRHLSSAIRDASSTNAAAITKLQESISGSLSDSINELTALMTPARWAYEDIETRLDGENFEQTIDGKSAALLLNTAELNASILSLFLLCAFGRRDNPLRTVVLDDPFENMDELTTTHVARALTRFLRLWKIEKSDDPWQILLLLHGAENVEHMCAETPCATYFLPWLSPLSLSEAASAIESSAPRFPLFPVA